MKRRHKIMLLMFALASILQGQDALEDINVRPCRSEQEKKHRQIIHRNNTTEEYRIYQVRNPKEPLGNQNGTDITIWENTDGRTRPNTKIKHHELTCNETKEHNIRRNKRDDWPTNEARNNERLFINLTINIKKSTNKTPQDIGLNNKGEESKSHASNPKSGRVHHTRSSKIKKLISGRKQQSNPKGEPTEQRNRVTEQSQPNVWAREIKPNNVLTHQKDSMKNEITRKTDEFQRSPREKNSREPMVGKAGWSRDHPSGNQGTKPCPNKNVIQSNFWQRSCMMSAGRRPRPQPEPDIQVDDPEHDLQQRRPDYQQMQEGGEGSTYSNRIRQQGSLGTQEFQPPISYLRVANKLKLIADHVLADNPRQPDARAAQLAPVNQGQDQAADQGAEDQGIGAELRAGPVAAPNINEDDEALLAELVRSRAQNQIQADIEDESPTGYELLLAKNLDDAALGHKLNTLFPQDWGFSPADLRTHSKDPKRRVIYLKAPKDRVANALLGMTEVIFKGAITEGNLAFYIEGKFGPASSATFVGLLRQHYHIDTIRHGTVGNGVASSLWCHVDPTQLDEVLTLVRTGVQFRTANGQTLLFPMSVSVKDVPVEKKVVVIPAGGDNTDLNTRFQHFCAMMRANTSLVGAGCAPVQISWGPAQDPDKRVVYAVFEGQGAATIKEWQRIPGGTRSFGTNRHQYQVVPATPAGMLKSTSHWAANMSTNLGEYRHFAGANHKGSLLRAQAKEAVRKKSKKRKVSRDLYPSRLLLTLISAYHIVSNTNWFPISFLLRLILSIQLNHSINRDSLSANSLTPSKRKRIYGLSWRSIIITALWPKGHPRITRYWSKKTYQVTCWTIITAIATAARITTILKRIGKILPSTLWMVAIIILALATPVMASSIKVISLNAQHGLEAKATNLKTLIKQENPQVILIQEAGVHKQQIPELEKKFKEWKLVTHLPSKQRGKRKKQAKGHSSGIITMIHKSIAQIIQREWRDDQHRALAVEGTYGNTKIAIWNVYAPVNPAENAVFWTDWIEVEGYPNAQENTILGGDLNSVIDTHRDYHSQATRQREVTPSLEEFMDTHLLVDALAEHDEQCRKADKANFNIGTWTRTHHVNGKIECQTRIDHFLLSPTMAEALTDFRTIENGFPSDHNPIAITLKIDEIDPSAYTEETALFIPKFKTRDLTPATKQEKWGKEPVTRTLTHPSTIATTEQLDELTDQFTVAIQTRAEGAFGSTKPPRKQKPKFLSDEELKRLCTERQEIHKLSKEIQRDLSLNVVDTEKTAALHLLLDSDPLSPQPHDRNPINRAKKATAKLKRKIKARISKLQGKAIQEAIQYNYRSARENAAKLLDKVLERTNNTQLTAAHPTSADENGQITSHLEYTSRSPEERNRIIWEYGRQLHDEYKPLPRQQPNWAQPSAPQLDDAETTGALTNPITPAEVSEAIKEATANTAPGPDRISNDILKCLNEEDKSWLAALLTKCIELHHLPVCWKNAYIRLLHKSGDPMDLTNYRGISLLPCTYKIYSAILQKRLRSTLEKHKLLSDLQSGFRAERGCHLNLHTVITALENAKRTNRNIHVLYIDIVKAFDSLQHAAIEEALRFHRIPDTFIRTIMSLYKECTAQIITSTTITDKFEIKRGVRQGDTLSPLLFILVVDILLLRLQNNVEGYKVGSCNTPAQALADDITILTEKKEEMELAWEITKDWSDRYSLLLNTKPGKTMYTTNATPEAKSILDYKGKTVEPKPATEYYKYLGIWINIELNWERQEKESVSTLAWLCSKIKHRKLPLHTKCYIINTAIAPSISYRMNFAQYTEPTLKRLQQIVTSTIASHLRTPHKINKVKLTASHKMGAIQLVDFQHLHIVSYVSTFMNYRLNPNASTTSSTLSEEEYAQSHFLPLLREGLHPPKQDRKKKNLFLPNNSITKFATFLHHLNWTCTANYTKNSKALDIIKAQPLRQNTQAQIDSLADQGIVDLDFQYPEEMKQKWTKKVQALYEQVKGLWRDQEPQQRPRTTSPNIQQTPIQSLQLYKCSKTNLSYALAWTDGSVIKKKAGYGVYVGPNAPPIIRRTRNAQTSMQSELEAIELALQIIPPNVNTIIFTDCLSAIQSIESFQHITTKERRKNVQAFTLARIQHEIGRRRSMGAIIKLEWVPSHIEEKKKSYEQMEDKEKGQKKLKSLQARCQELEDSYPDQFNTIIQGNEKADELAKVGTKQPNRENKEWFPHGTTKYYLRKENGEIVEGNIRMHLKKVMMDRADQELQQLRQKSTNWTAGQIDDTKFTKGPSHKLNTIALKPKQTEESQKLDGLCSFRLRVMDRRLPTAVQIHKYKDKITDPEQAKYLNDKYQTANCQLCDTGSEEDLNHVLFDCPYTQTHRNKHQQLIEDALQESPTKQYIPNVTIPTIPESIPSFSKMEAGIIMLGYIPKETYNAVKAKLEDTKETEQTITKLHNELIRTTKALWNDSRKAVHNKFTNR